MKQLNLKQKLDNCCNCTYIYTHTHKQKKQKNIAQYTIAFIKF